MTNKTMETVDLASAGPKLLAHSKTAAFTAKRGLVVELFPFIFGAGERMSAKAISDHLASESKIHLSAVTISKALANPHKHWNQFFDTIEDAVWSYAGMLGPAPKDFLFEKEHFVEAPKFVKAAAKALVSDKVQYARNVLVTKWFSIDWDIRVKARPFLEHRLVKKGGK